MGSLFGARGCSHEKGLPGRWATKAWCVEVRMPNVEFASVSALT